MIDEGSGETDRVTVKLSSSDCAYTLITPPSEEMDLMTPTSGWEGGFSRVSWKVSAPPSAASSPKGKGQAKNHSSPNGRPWGEVLIRGAGDPYDTPGCVSSDPPCAGTTSIRS